MKKISFLRFLMVMCVFISTHTSVVHAIDASSRVAVPPNFNSTIQEIPRRLPDFKIILPTTATVPLLKGKTLNMAKTALAQSKLSLGNVTYQTSRAARGTVLSQKPPVNSKVVSGTQVSVVLAKPYKVTPVPPPLKISITPPRPITVIQGQTASFTVNYNKKNVQVSWKGARKTGSKKTFIVNTSKLQPGKYPITVNVKTANIILLSRSQRPRAENASAKTTLIVKRQVTTPPPTPLTLSISPKQPITVVQGQSATFTAHYNYPQQNIGLTWQGGSQSGHNKSFTVTTSKLAPGRYPITVKARFKVVVSSRVLQGAEISVAQTTLIIKPRVSYVIVPNILQKDLKTAKAILGKAGLSVGTTKTKVISSGTHHQVINQNPKPSKRVVQGSKVNLEVTKLQLPPISISVKPKKKTVPQGEIVTFTADYSPQTLSLTWKGAHSFSTKKTYTIKTSSLGVRSYTITLTGKDKSGRVKKDSAILVVTAPQPTFVRVPKLTGLPLEDALSRIHPKELKKGNVSYQVVNSGKDKRVLTQSPTAHSRVQTGSRVNLLVAKLELPPLSLRITPNQRTVQQGETASFKANSSPDNLNLFWKAAGKTYRSTRIQINTTALDPATYTVRLTANDEHERQVKDTAKLIILPRAEPTSQLISVPDVLGLAFDQAVTVLGQHDLRLGETRRRDVTTGESNHVLQQTPSPLSKVKPGSSVNLTLAEVIPIVVPTPDSKPEITEPEQPTGFSLVLSAERSHQLMGEASFFQIIPAMPVDNAEYRLYFNGNSHSNWSSETRPIHHFFNIGRQSIYAQAMINGQTYSSNKIDIWVWPIWLSYVFGGIGLLTLGVGISKAAAPTATHIKLQHPPQLSVNAQLDMGTQQIIHIKTPIIDQTIEFEFDYGLPGVQVITQDEISINHQEEES